MYQHVYFIFMRTTIKATHRPFLPAVVVLYPLTSTCFL